MPFLFWRATWFGRPIPDGQLRGALADGQRPREVQHALSQIADRIVRGDPAVKRWYPEVVALSQSKRDEIRVMVAWVMGQDNRSLEFHTALLRLLQDPQPMVERNAALSLVRFHDDSGRRIIVSMLHPYVVLSPCSGTLDTRLKPGETTNPGTLVAEVEAGGKRREVRTAVPGKIKQWLASGGQAVASGEPLVLIEPSEQMVWESLRALYLIGTPQDVPDVAPYARAADGAPPAVAEQAKLTLDAIRQRVSAPSPSRAPR